MTTKLQQIRAPNHQPTKYTNRKPKCLTLMANVMPDLPYRKTVKITSNRRQSRNHVDLTS